jgi:hypothetical protein
MKILAEHQKRCCDLIGRPITTRRDTKIRLPVESAYLHQKSGNFGQHIRCVMLVAAIPYRRFRADSFRSLLSSRESGPKLQLGGQRNKWHLKEKKGIICSLFFSTSCLISAR